MEENGENIDTLKSLWKKNKHRKQSLARHLKGLLGNEFSFIIFLKIFIYSLIYQINITIMLPGLYLPIGIVGYWSSGGLQKLICSAACQIITLFQVYTKYFII